MKGELITWGEPVLFIMDEEWNPTPEEMASLRRKLGEAQRYCAQPLDGGYVMMCHPSLEYDLMQPWVPPAYQHGRTQRSAKARKRKLRTASRLVW